jgi:hypothetical protein
MGKWQSSLFLRATFGWPIQMAWITVGWWPIKKNRRGGIHGHGVVAPARFRRTMVGSGGGRGSIVAMAGGDSI